MLGRAHGSLFDQLARVHGQRRNPERETDHDLAFAFLESFFQGHGLGHGDGNGLLQKQRHVVARRLDGVGRMQVAARADGQGIQLRAPHHVRQSLVKNHVRFIDIVQTRPRAGFVRVHNSHHPHGRLGHPEHFPDHCVDALTIADDSQSDHNVCPFR